MHPAATFRHGDPAFHRSLIEQVGFGMIFAATPDGPRVAHTPMVMVGDDRLQFHLARSNALTSHLTQVPALIVVGGPDAYISPRWYGGTDEVPTWNYIAVELEGPIAQMDDTGLRALLRTIGARHEARIEEGEAWTMDAVSEERIADLLPGIVGFELHITTRRDTVKLSQNKSAVERLRIAAGLERQGATGLADIMRETPS